MGAGYKVLLVGVFACVAMMAWFCTPARADYCFAFDPAFIATDARQPEMVRKLRNRKTGETHGTQTSEIPDAGQGGTVFDFGPRPTVEQPSDAAFPLLLFPDGGFAAAHKTTFEALLREMALVGYGADTEAEPADLLSLYELREEGWDLAGASSLARRIVDIRFLEAVGSFAEAQTALLESCEGMMKMGDDKRTEAERCLVANSERLRKHGFSFIAARFLEKAAQLAAEKDDAAMLWLAAAECHQEAAGGHCAESYLCAMSALEAAQTASKVVLAECYAQDYLGGLGGFQSDIRIILQKALGKVKGDPSATNFLLDRHHNL